MSALQHFRAPDGLAPGPGYSHAVTGRGRWVEIEALGDLRRLTDPKVAPARARFAP
jgi:hypothetical protein